MAPMGTIRERSPGHFEIRAFAGRSPSGSPRYVQETYVHHRKDGGVQAARKRLKALESRAAAIRSTTTFGSLLDDWLSHAKRIGRAPNTLTGYAWRVKAIKEALGAVELDKLTARDLDSWYGQLLEHGKSPADVRAYHRIISAALIQGEKWDAVGRNVAKKAGPPRVPDAEVKTPAPAEVRTLIAAAERSKTPEMASIIFWACITGMRRGEICGLHWDRVDWKGERVEVSRAVWQYTSRIGEKDTKGHQARSVSVGKIGIHLLRARLARATEDAEAAGVAVDPSGYVWSTDLVGAEPWQPDRITQAFGRLSRAAGWTYRLHDLRHYSATELLNAGVALPTVSERLGHRRTSTTADIYGHGREDTDKRAAEILGKALQVPAAPGLAP